MEKMIIALGVLLLIQNGVCALLAACVKSQAAQNQRLLDWIEELSDKGGE